MLDKINEYRKAIAAFLVPGLTVLATSLADGVVTPQEWIAIVIASLTSTVAVALIPNEITDDQINPRHLAEPTAVAARLVSEENRRIRGDQ